jgi:hypothetical protein
MNTHALITLWNTTQQHIGTSGARVCAGVLLGLYNGDRFPLDLTELRLLDDELLQAAMEVIHSDAERCQREVHDWLNVLTGRGDFGDRIEHLAHEYGCFKRGRCKVAYLAERPITPTRLIIQAEAPPVQTSAQPPAPAPFCGIDIPDFLRRHGMHEETSA